MTDFLKASINKTLSMAGLRMSKIPKDIDPIAPFDLLELAVQAALSGDQKNFYFVQIGANDGIMHDTLNRVIRKFELNGCLIEPMPDVFEQLVRNYQDQPQLQFLNCMITDELGIQTISRFRRDAPVPAEFYHGLARSDRDYIEGRARQVGLEDFVETIQCPAMTFADLVAELPGRDIGLLYIDTEGSDDKIIYSAFAAGVYPAIINYEWTEMSAARRRALKLRLLDGGYRFIDVGADTVCLRVDRA